MEITRKNFAEQMDNIIKDIKLSCFIGFDAEFTAILSKECFRHRLFDSNEERYNKLKTQVSNMLMTQVGLTMFQYDRDHDTYIATGYTFHLSPQVIGDIDQSFMFQASTLNFLCRHNFNFNKFTYEGIPFLSKAEEAKLRKLQKNKTLFGCLSNAVEIDDNKQLQQLCSEVSKWLTKSDEGTMYIDIQNAQMRYILHNEIRLRFPGVLTTDSLGNSNKILIYRDKYVDGANSAPMEILEENMLNNSLGFSQVLSLLSTYQKPIVGHNVFLDTILFHNQFIGPLPKKYSVFKKNINNMFPAIYDTKLISNEMGRQLTLDEVWKSNILQDLYEFFSEGKCKKLKSGINFIKLSSLFNVNQSYHEAGWDSYCAGYCFIRLGHWAACENSGFYRLIGPTEKISVLAHYCNKVNVIRAAVPYMNLVGDDPPRHRPSLLHVKALSERPINVGKMATMLTSFGSIDVRPYGKQTALIAASTQNMVNKILAEYKNSREYKISKYSVYRHSPAGRMAMWGGALLTGSVVLYLLHNKVKL